MRLLKGRPNKTEAEEPEVDDADDDQVQEPADESAAPARERRQRRWGRRTTTVSMTVPERSVRRTATIPSRPVESTATRAGMSLGALLAIACGAVLAVIGSVALLRAGVDDTWFRPRVEVLDADHTALLGALEIGAGLLLLLAGLTRSRMLVAILGFAMAVAATAVAVEPDELQRELVVETWWAWTLAAAGAALALSALHVPRERRRAIVDVA